MTQGPDDFTEVRGYPHDYGSDTYDLIELSVAEGEPIPPLPAWLSPDWMPCLDCRANAFLHFPHPFADPIHPRYDPSFVGTWEVTVAHDEGCPFMAVREAR